jgi:Flp pilus assembly pilin Flp
MAQIIRAVKQFFCASEAGTTTVEYAIMVVAIAAVIVALVLALGEKVEDAFRTTLKALHRLRSLK